MTKSTLSRKIEESIGEKKAVERKVAEKVRTTTKRPTTSVSLNVYTKDITNDKINVGLIIKMMASTKRPRAGWTLIRFDEKITTTLPLENGQLSNSKGSLINQLLRNQIKP